ncbi:MAG: hypothetical protein ACI9AX_002695, partial [Polaromonas sp.]
VFPRNQRAEVCERGAGLYGARGKAGGILGQAVRV